MLLDALAGRGLILTGGKGGVGKTTTAATLAAGLAARGEPVLLVSTDPAHNLGHIFERDVGPEPLRLAPNLLALELDPASAVTAHLEAVGATLRRLMPAGSGGEVARHMDRARHAPGMAEAALLDRLADLAEAAVRTGERLVIDTAPTGHTLALLQLPEMMTAWTDGLLKNREESDRFARRARALSGRDEAETPRDLEIRQILGRRREKLAGLRAVLTDPARTGFVLVTTPERMPVLETAAMARALDGTGIAPAALVANRVKPGMDDAALAARLSPLDGPLKGAPRFAMEEARNEPMGLAALEAAAERFRAVQTDSAGGSMDRA